MRNQSLGSNIGAILRRCKKMETTLRQAGMPAFLACLPLALLALQYALILREKNANISRISRKIVRWQATVSQLSAHDCARTEFIDLDRKMRADIEGASDSMCSLRDLCLAGLQRMGLSTPVPRGAFYLFPDVGEYADARGSVGFCEDLLEQQDLALVPGAAFGQDRHVRLSYALGRERIAEALVRLEAFLRARRAAPVSAPR